MKKFNKIEYIVKGFSNRLRIKIIFLLKKQPELSVKEIAEKLEKNEKNISQHLQKMMASGVIVKRYSDKEVRQRLTTKGEFIYDFLSKL